MKESISKNKPTQAFETMATNCVFASKMLKMYYLHNEIFIKYDWSKLQRYICMRPFYSQNLFAIFSVTF